MELSQLAHDNLLIAEFMGLEIEKTLSGEKVYAVPLMHPEHEFREFTGFFGAKDLLYHAKWDWLMPVVVKLNLLDNYAYSVNILPTECFIYDLHNRIVASVESKNIEDGLILSVHGTVVKFLKWYNKQK